MDPQPSLEGSSGHGTFVVGSTTDANDDRLDRADNAKTPNPKRRLETRLLVDPATGPEVRSTRSSTGSRDCSTRWGRLVGREVAGWVRGRAG
jgi:hypothetical protein